MSIKDRQIEYESERVLMRELVAGRYPDLSTIQNKVAKRFQKREAGLPRFVPIAAIHNEISSSSDYNEMMDSVQEDLAISFDEIRYQADRMMSLADYYDTEKHSIQRASRMMARRIEELNEKLEDRGLRTVIFDTFSDYVQLEFNEDSTRSLPKTDSFVDLRNGYAILDKVENGKDKVDVSVGEVKVFADSAFVSFTALSPAANALNDMINEAWRHEAISSQPGEGRVTLTITFPNPVEMNVISMITQSPRSTEVSLKTISEDGVTKSHLKREAFGFTEWTFERQAVKSIEMKLMKSEADAVVGSDYYYYFGAESISVRNIDFVQSNRVVSKPHLIKRVADVVSIKVEEWVPPSTDIQFFVAEDEMDGSIIEWRAITPGEKLKLERLETRVLDISNMTQRYGVAHSIYYNHNFYVLGRMPDVPIDRTIELYVGSGMMQVDEMPLTAGAVYEPTLADWKGARYFDRKYVDLSEVSGSNVMAVAPERLGRMIVSFDMQEAYTLLANPITVTGDIGISVYLNNTKLKGIGDDYTYNFQKGINKLEIIYYSHTGGTIAPNLSKTYMASIGALDIFANSEPMEQVDLYDLQNNTSKTDYTRFAVDKNRDLILNYNPASMNAGAGVVYKLKYKYKKPGMKDETYLRFMAQLSRDSDKEDLTPILYSYKLIVE